MGHFEVGPLLPLSHRHNPPSAFLGGTGPATQVDHELFPARLGDQFGEAVLLEMPVHIEQKRGRNDMGGSRSEPVSGSFRSDSATYLEAVAVGRECRMGGGHISRAEQDDMSAAKVIHPIPVGKPLCWTVAHEIGLQSAAMIRQGSANDLFYSSLVQVDAGAEAGERLIGTSSGHECGQGKGELSHRSGGNPAAQTRIAGDMAFGKRHGVELLLGNLRIWQRDGTSGRNRASCVTNLSSWHKVTGMRTSVLFCQITLGWFFFWGGSPALQSQTKNPAKDQKPAVAVKFLGEEHVYKTVEGRGLRLLVIKPPGWKASDRRPALVLFHGGGWTGGAPTQFNDQCTYLATRGMVCVQVEYRLLKQPGVPPLDCVRDAKSAMRWVRRQAGELGIDPGRLGAGGGSAGGHLAAFVGMVEGLDDPADDLAISPKANALVLFNPVFDNGPDQGWGSARVGEQFPAYSPAHNISADDPPAIVFLGSEDKLIPVAVLGRFKAGMIKAGVRCEAFVYEGQGHGFFNKDPWKTRTLVEADKFLASLGWIEGVPTITPP